MINAKTGFVILSCTISLVLGGIVHGKPAAAKPKLVAIMLDGCRWDYFSRAEADHPGYKKFKNEGVVAEYVQPVYPASSLQSWTTIATGLYPESHQMIGNNMYDQDTGDKFMLDNDTMLEDPKWTRSSIFPLTLLQLASSCTY